MNTVTTPLNKPREQQFIQTGVSWESFKAIQQGFDGVISLHYLEPDGYQKISHSRFLPDLDVKLLTLCAAISSRRQVVQDFRGEGTVEILIQPVS
jgi:hypothetical protein